MSYDDDKPLHIAMYSWFAMGHLTSFLHLANELAERGHKISFFLPSKTQPKLASHNLHPTLITFIPIGLPPVDGLPSWAETTNDVAPSSIPLIMNAMDLTKDTIASHLAHLKLDYIFFDFTSWVPGLARTHGVKSIYFSTVYLFVFAYTSPRVSHHLTEAGLVDAPPGFPNPAIKLRAYEARVLAEVFASEFGEGMGFHERQIKGIQQSDAIVGKGCREMEGPYIEFVEKLFRKPVFLAGPVVPKPPSSALDHDIDVWLKGFCNASVVYCALGSECVLEKQQFHELLLGLELTGMPFLAALKPPAGYETIESAFPDGFVERTKDRGLVHGGWVQQQLILHHPSVGCFVTHCGAGSLSEALVSECQLVLMPQGVDQFLNARMMSKELKVGVEVEKSEYDGSFTKESVARAVSMVMGVESEVGGEVRANHAKWKAFLLKEGLEESYVSSFVHNLRELL